MKLSIHKLTKQLEREKQHKQWLEKNLKHSRQHWVRAGELAVYVCTSVYCRRFVLSSFKKNQPSCETGVARLGSVSGEGDNGRAELLKSTPVGMGGYTTRHSKV